MCPVAVRLFLATLAAAPGHGFRFGDHFSDGAHADFFVGTVAEGLFPAFTAGTPGVAARLHFHDKGGVLGVGEFPGHNFVSRRPYFVSRKIFYDTRDARYERRPSLFQQIQPRMREKIRPRAHALAVADADLIEDLDAVIFAEVTKILQAQKSQVRRVVPFVGQFFGNGNAALEKDLQTGAHVTKIRDTDDDFLAHPQSFQDHLARLQDLLQAFVEDHVIEAFIGVIRQPRVDVDVRDREAFGHTAVNGLFVDLNAGAVTAAVFDQQFQQNAVAAAQVQHAGAFLNQLDNDLVVEADILYIFSHMFGKIR